MSSDRIERKRRSEFDTSDNFADEAPAVKIIRLDPSISFTEKVSGACKRFFNWVTPTFFKKMAVRVSHQTSSSAMRIGAENSERNQYSIDLSDDDDEEISVIGVQNGTGAHSRSANTLKIDTPSKSTRSSSYLKFPLASTPQSFPLSSDNIYDEKVSKAMERRKMNGHPAGTNTARDSRSRRGEKCSAPITNPRSEIDILLEKDKDVEIISEVYPAKHSSGPTRKIRLLSNPHSSRNNRTSFLGDFINNDTRSPYSSRSYTANEVVRLQEKAQYRLLLDKVVKRNPLFQLAIPRKDSKSSTVQVDLTEEEDLFEANSHFKKEKVDVNLNDFLTKYYKPCVLVPRAVKMESQLNHTQRVSERETSIDDDDIQIIDYPELPKLKPRKSTISLEGFFSDAWIADMKISMLSSTEKRLQIVSEEEKKVQRYKNRREARNAEEMRKREEQRLAGIVFPEDVEMEEEVLPEITPEMDAVIEKAYGQHNEELLSCMDTNRDSYDVTRADISTLSSLNWLNDKVINFYFALIEKRSKLDGYPTVYCFTSFFYTKLKKEGPSRALLRWTRKTDIFANDILFVPLHLDLHWALLVVDLRNKQIKYYDSMGSGESQSLKIVENYLMTEYQDKKKMVLEPNTYSFEIPKDIPKQMNGSDCGMFTLKYAEYISRDAPITFTQENMPYFRRRMVYELITQQIL